MKYLFHRLRLEQTINFGEFPCIIWQRVLNVGAFSRKLEKSFSPTNKVSFIELYQPDNVSTAQELAAAYRIDINDIEGIIPEWIPTKDKQLFESYLELFRHTDQIPYGPEGIFQTSGIELGMFIANHQVEILRDGTTYDRDGILIECPPDSYGCTIPTSLDPSRNNHIFINGLQAASVNFHAGIIAHEAFHLTLPFNTMQNSLYEEMTAITIGYKISNDEDNEMYTFNYPSDLTTTFTEAEITGYITTYCGETCTYFDLPMYPDTWETILQMIASEINENE